MAKRPSARDTPCKFFLEGRCERGDACQFRHEGLDGDLAPTLYPHKDGLAVVGSEPPAKRAKGDKGGGKGGKPDRNYAAAFKLIFPDASVACIIGASGATRKEMEEECQAHIQISGRDQFYPGTRCRMLIIQADSNDNILQVLDRIVDKLVDRVASDAEKGKGKSAADEDDALIGKEPGEYVFRALMPKLAIGRLMGSGGAHIKQIRETSGAKIFVEKDSYGQSQCTKVIGTPEALRHALGEVLDCIAQELTPQQLQEWGSQMTVEDGGGGKGGGRSGKGHWDDSYDQQDGGWHGHGSGKGSASLEAMGKLAADFPGGALDMDYEMNCEMPNACVGGLIGERGENVKWVEDVTGAKVKFGEKTENPDDTRTMTVTGGLIACYQAHMHMMKMYHDAEQENSKQEKVAALQAQLAALSKQLEDIEGPGSPGTGKGKSKGKGKR